MAVVGVSSEGLTTTVFPHINAGATFQVIRSNGRFQGQMTAITPRGVRRRYLSAPLPSGVGDGNASPITIGAKSANVAKLAAPRGISRCDAISICFPVSKISARRNSSDRSDILAASLRRIVPRSLADNFAQGPFKAAFAARTAMSTCSGVASAIS